MPHSLHRHFTYANVVASLALFLALGGGAAWAANEFSGANIRDETLTGADVKGRTGVEGTLTGLDLKGGSVKGADIATGTISGRRVADDSLKGADIDESSLAGVRDGRILSSGRLVVAQDTSVTLLRAGGVTIEGRCTGDVPRTRRASIVARFDPGTAHVYPSSEIANTGATSAANEADGTPFSAANSSGGKAIQGFAHAIANPTERPEGCLFVASGVVG